MATLLVWLTRLCFRTPRAILVLVALSLVPAGLVAQQTLSFSADRTQLLRPDHPVQVNYRRFKQIFPGENDIVVYLRGGSESEREQAVAQLAERLEQESALFTKVLTRFELEFLKDRALLYLTSEQLSELELELRQARPWLAALGRESRLEAILKAPAQLSPTLDRVLDQLIASFESRGRAPYLSPFSRAQPDPGQGGTRHGTRVYLTSRQGEVSLLLARPADRKSRAAVHRLRELLKEVRGLQVELTGEPVLQAQEALDTTRGAVIATISSVMLCNLLLVLGFGAFWRAQLIVLVMSVGLTWSMAFAGLTVGILNLVTINFPCILVGLGVDFGIHWLLRYEELRASGLAPLPAMEQTMWGSGVENLTGALSTAVAFLALRFTTFRAVADLGLISGVGVMLSFLAMAVMLPSLLFLTDRRSSVPPLPPSRWLPAERWVAGHPGLVLTLTALGTLWCASFIPRLHFDYNLLHMHAPGSPPVQAERQLQQTGRTSLVALIAAPTASEARRLVGELEELPTVARVECLVTLLPEQDRSARVAAALAPVQGLPRPGAPPHRSVQELLELEPLFAGLDRRLRRLLASRPEPERKVGLARLDRLKATLDGMGPGPIEEGLESFEQHLMEDVRAALEQLQSQRPGPAIGVEDLPGKLRERGIGPNGEYLLTVHPRENVWERPALARFVGELEQVEPSVTGSPVLIYHYLGELKRAYETSWRNALVIIVLLLLVHFRSLKLAGLALLPKLLGVVWMLGLMGACGVNFNPANFMALPLTLGIGLVYGVHVVHGRDQGYLFAHSTGPAVALAAITTIAGFGSLMLADHRGIASLGFVMASGVLANLIGAELALPALLRLTQRPRPPG
ncbi:hypothetical protein DYH09_19265 [bacterium CPR1]|nr:hypothetical protein [bacterium CPR1]